MSELQPKHIRVALYARVSTDEQREGQTIDAQIAEVERFAKDKGWSVANIYKDEGWSGSLLVRPALDRLRDDATRGVFDAIIVNDVDRLARDVSHLGILKRDFERKRIQLIFRKLPAETSPTYNLMVNILGSFAEFERELIIDRTRRGRRHKVEVRKQYVGCVAAYGYHYQTGSASDGKEAVITIVPEEAKVVRQIYSLALGGMSVDRIALRLTELGVHTRRNKRVWSGCTVYRILRNETYAGQWAYGKGENCEPKKYRVNKPYRRITKTGRRRKPRSEWLRVDLGQKLAIIDPELWRKVQARIDSNGKFSPRNSKFFYLLQGLVRCGYCGRGWAAAHSRHGEKFYLYYHCWNRACKRSRWIPVHALESTVWSALRNFLSNPKLLAKRIADAQEEMDKKSSAEIPPSQPEKEIRRTQESSLFARYRSGQLSPQQLADGLQALAEHAEKTRDASEGPAKVNSIRSLEEICRQVLAKLDAPTPSLQREILRRLVSEIVVEVDRVRVRVFIPTEPESDVDRPPYRPSIPDADADPISVSALPLLREHIGNMRMQIQIVAVLPPPARNTSAALRARYSAACGRA